LDPQAVTARTEAVAAATATILVTGRTVLSFDPGTADAGRHAVTRPRLAPPVGRSPHQGRSVSEP
jgi:hypothetical protein